MTPQEALAKLPSFLDANPVFLTDASAAQLLEQTAESEFHVDPWAYAIALKTYKQSKVAAPAAVPVVDLAARIAADRTGLLQEVLGPSDPDGHIAEAMKTDYSGNIEAAILAQMLDHVSTLRDAMAKSTTGLADMLRKDPLGRLPESAAVLYGRSVDPNSMPSPGRLGEVARSNGLKLVLPAQYAAEVSL